MEQQKRYFTKVHYQKVDKTKPKTKEVKILNTESNKLQDADDKTLVLDVLVATSALKTALKKLNIHNLESNELQVKEIFKVLADTQNMINLKILSLKKCQGNKVEKQSSETKNAQCSPQSSTEFSFGFSELTSKELSSPEYGRNNSVDSESEALSASKLMSLSKLSLCSSVSSQNVFFNGDDDDDDDDDNKKFKEFLAKVNCPFCLKHADNKNCLSKHLERDCVAFKSKIFVSNLDCPYSVFQILPNNTLKCNICPNSVQSSLKKYFKHTQSASHISAYNKAASHKSFTELIFCASCKIQILNNAAHILFHMEHEVHQRNRKEQRSTHFYRQKGVVCVYSKEKKFKCLYCPLSRAIHKTVSEILVHLESEAHLSLELKPTKQPRKRATVFCDFCLAEVSIYNVIGHFDSSGHVLKEEEESDNEFQFCLYCGFKCSKLVLLARHTEDCPALDLRQEDKRQECEEVDRFLTQIEKDQKRFPNEKTSEKGRCIIVKDYPKILELYHYFKQFGEVLEIEPAGENAVMIKFQEEKVVDRILERGRLIEINGVKPRITRKEDLDSFDMKAVLTLSSSKTAESTNPCPVAKNYESDPSLDPSLASSNVIGVSSSTAGDDFFKIPVDGNALESLFNRVSSHLSHTVLKADCEDFLNIALDCEQILKKGKCHPVGFLKCGLTFPVEKITLYYEFSNILMKDQCLDDNSTSLTESFLFNQNMCKECVRLFKSAEVLSRVSLREKSFSFVEFYHNKTQKLCSITFRQSDNILADELRYCLNDNRKLRSFVLIIRFWLSVHRLEIREFETVIISLLLFFLLRSGLVNTPSENFRKKSGHEILNKYVAIQDCAGHYQSIPEYMKTHKENSIMEMFEKFLLFLNRFDFENMAICLPLIYPVPKTMLLQDSLKKYVCKGYNPKSPVWIMDPFLFNNVAEDVKKADWESLLKTVRETIEHYHIN